MVERHDVRLPLSAWQAETLRLTAFPAPSANISTPTWWTELLGGPAETKVLRPSKGGELEEGPFEGGRLRLMTQLSRIDWALFPIPAKAEGAEGFLTVGAFLKILDPFLRLMLRWFELQTCPSVQRLAFGAVLILPVENTVAGHRLLSAYLPIKLDPEDASDFGYQINRRRDSKSGIPGLRINRLSKWSVLSIQTIELSLGQSAARYYPGGEQFACRLELDINTIQEFQGEFSREQLPGVFQELVDLGCEIASLGDVP